ncbi:hypothetical protein CMV16_26820, partial [Peribacillus simplex]
AQAHAVAAAGVVMKRAVGAPDRDGQVFDVAHAGQHPFARLHRAGLVMMAPGRIRLLLATATAGAIAAVAAAAQDGPADDRLHVGGEYPGIFAGCGQNVDAVAQYAP